MRKKDIVSICLLLALCLPALRSQSAFITQVDSGDLLAAQRNRLYARFLDKAGRPVENPDTADLSVLESSDGSSFLEADELRVLSGSNKPLIKRLDQWTVLHSGQRSHEQHRAYTSAAAT